jgi:hypothetical protein
VNIDFLMEVLKGRGFGEDWCKWVSMVVIGGSVSVTPNGKESISLKMGKGLRQEDPLSLLLFNLVGDALNRMLVKTSNRGLISGVPKEFRPEGIMSLEYADDTMLFSASDDSCIRNMRIILMLFDKVLGMMINFHKSEMIPLNLDHDRIYMLSHRFFLPNWLFAI